MLLNAAVRKLEKRVPPESGGEFEDFCLDVFEYTLRKRNIHVGCIFWQPADFSANSDEVIQPSAYNVMHITY
ncbi:hypothetical protein [Scandinavium manionii]|uniref:hypothetical protein n=1 Tax=Scandinavium manionii TaxID=2926520 RepID=UPI001357B61E|nr:hypothetical protein [Scandinavium manionii]MCS2164484.1 hypothetical protein [Scandinavium manionii]